MQKIFFIYFLLAAEKFSFAGKLTALPESGGGAAPSPSGLYAYDGDFACTSGLG